MSSPTPPIPSFVWDLIARGYAQAEDPLADDQRIFRRTSKHVRFFADMSDPDALDVIWPPILSWVWLDKNLTRQQRIRIVGLELVRLDGIPLDIADANFWSSDDAFGNVSYTIGHHHGRRQAEGRWTSENLTALFRTVYSDEEFGPFYKEERPQKR